MLLLAAWTDPWSWSEQDIALLTAIGTVGAVIVAVSAGIVRWAREARNQPKLRLSSDDLSERAIETVVRVGPKGGIKREQAIFVRIAVSNERGRRSADDVEVLVVRIDSDERVIDQGTLTRWANQTRLSFPPLGWTHVEPTQVTIAPGVTRTVDLGWNVRGVSEFELALKPPPLSGIHRLVPGTYTITLAVSARNVNAVHYSLSLWFDGPWDNPDEAWPKVRVIDGPARVRRP